MDGARLGGELGPLAPSPLGYAPGPRDTRRLDGVHDTNGLASYLITMQVL